MNVKKVDESLKVEKLCDNDRFVSNVHKINTAVAKPCIAAIEEK